MNTFLYCEDMGSADTWINSNSHLCKEKEKQSTLASVSVCCQCNVRKLCVFTGSENPTTNFLPFSRQHGSVLCTASSTAVAHMFGDFSILAYTLHSACDSPGLFSLCMSDTCFGNYGCLFLFILTNSLWAYGSIAQTCFPSFIFIVVKFAALSALQAFHFHSCMSTFTPSSVISNNKVMSMAETRNAWWH